MAALTDVIRPIVTEDLSIVNSLKKSPIKNIFRVYSKYDMDRLEEKKIEKKLAFSYFSGPIIFHFEDGNSGGFDDEELRDSIVCWHEKYNGIECEEYFFYRDGCSYLNYDDPTYSIPSLFSDIVGQKISSITAIDFPLKPNSRIIGDVRQDVVILKTPKASIALAYSRSVFPTHFSIEQEHEIPQSALDFGNITIL